MTARSRPLTSGWPASKKAGRAELGKLDAARSKRGLVLASLTAESREREQSLTRMKQEQGALEKLLRELKRAIQNFPPDNGTAFGRLRGKLAWPVEGRVVARFGETRAAGVKWDGVVVATERGSPVRAVYEGRVVYADWLPGLGLLTIVDHGDGYLSLYGHNDRLYKSAGDRVSSGEQIGAAGDSGGRKPAGAVLRDSEGRQTSRSSAVVQGRQPLAKPCPRAVISAVAQAFRSARFANSRNIPPRGSLRRWAQPVSITVPTG